MMIELALECTERATKSLTYEVHMHEIATDRQAGHPGEY